MHRIVASVTTLEQHFQTLVEAPETYRLSACPRCGRGRPWGHGCYQRKVDRRPAPDGSRRVAPVPRYFCRGCGRTHSRLPRCIAPRRWYDWIVQQLALVWTLAGVSVRAGAQTVGVDRHTVRRWRDWLQAPAAARYVFHLRSRWPQLGRVDDGPPFWREALAHLGLPQAMASLDRELTVP
jgi:transposase-like protein